MTEGTTVLTIGHSNHSLARLIELLEVNGVTAVADIRSTPYSRIRPEFNREQLQRTLLAEGIEYVFLGRELGARPDDRSCYRDGRVSYRVLAQTNAFEEGLQRVLRGARAYRLALLCAEREPLSCHRSVLVARELENLGVTVLHIRADGTLEPHSETVSRLLTTLGLDKPDLFRTREEAIEDAYAWQEKRIAHVDGGPGMTDRESAS